MIRLPGPRIRSMIEAMPIKCRVVDERDASSVPVLTEHYFYKAVTTAAFSFMKGRVAYVEAAEWARAKRAMRRKGTVKSAAANWRRSTIPKRTMVRPRNGDSPFVKVYLQRAYSEDDENAGGLVTVTEAETIECRNALPVPPTTTDRDVRELVESLARMPQFQAVRKSLVHIVRYERDLENHKSRLDRHITARLSLLIAQALKKPIRTRRVLGAHQPLPNPLTAPAVLKARIREAVFAPTMDRVLFKALPAYSSVKLRSGAVRYVMADEWIGGNCRSVQMYARISAGLSRTRGLPPGTVDASGEGLVLRDQVLLVPPRTSSSMMKRIIEKIEVSDLALRASLRTLSWIDAEIRDEWMKAMKIMKKERRLQMRHLCQAFAMPRELAYTANDH